MLIVSRPLNSAGIIPFATTAMVRYGSDKVEYEFMCIRGTEYLTVIAKNVKCREWEALLKKYGLLKRKK